MRPSWLDWRQPEIALLHLTEWCQFHPIQCTGLESLETDPTDGGMEPGTGDLADHPQPVSKRASPSSVAL